MLVEKDYLESQEQEDQMNSNANLGSERRASVVVKDHDSTPDRRTSLDYVREQKANMKIKLMSQLVNHKTQVDDDTILLINASEVLTRDGIQGKIATVGVGFGTGRHTMKRKSPSPLASREKPSPPKTKFTSKRMPPEPSQKSPPPSKPPSPP